MRITRNLDETPPSEVRCVASNRRVVDGYELLESVGQEEREPRGELSSHGRERGKREDPRVLVEKLQSGAIELDELCDDLLWEVLQ